MRGLVLSLLLLSCAPPDDDGARALEGRLIAPCCWTQTLDVHESEPASALRSEIAARLRQGQSSASIEADLAARYGARIHAVTPHADARPVIPAVTGAGMLASALALAAWGRRRKALAIAPERPAADDYDARLDAELED